MTFLPQPSEGWDYRTFTTVSLLTSSNPDYLSRVLSNAVTLKTRTSIDEWGGGDYALSLTEQHAGPEHCTEFSDSI